MLEHWLTEALVARLARAPWATRKSTSAASPLYKHQSTALNPRYTDTHHRHTAHTTSLVSHRC